LRHASFSIATFLLDDMDVLWCWTTSAVAWAAPGTKSMMSEPPGNPDP
jgi:hypothetical protein